jgi:hypothetical protein
MPAATATAPAEPFWLMQLTADDRKLGTLHDFRLQVGPAGEHHTQAAGEEQQ